MNQNNLRVVTAQTKFSNNAETDMQKYVMHVVTLSDGTTREIHATDPMDAIDKVENSLKNEEVKP